MRSKQFITEYDYSISTQEFTQFLHKWGSLYKTAFNKGYNYTVVLNTVSRNVELFQHIGDRLYHLNQYIDQRDWDTPQTTIKSSYARVSKITTDGSIKEQAVHIIVAYAFNGKDWMKQKKEGKNLDHEDSNRYNNDPENIKFMDKEENRQKGWDNKQKHIYYMANEEKWMKSEEDFNIERV